MVILKKMLIPLLKKYLRLFISMIIVSALGIASVIGVYGVYYNLDRGVSNYINEYGYEDILIDTELSNYDLKDLYDIEGVASVNTRLKIDVSLKNNRVLTGRVFTYKEDDFKKFYIREESKEEKDRLPIYLDYHFAKGNNIKIGDEFIIYSFGFNIKAYCDKIVSCPECISIKQNRYITGESDEFGFFYVNYEKVKSLLEPYGLETYYNEIEIKTKDIDNSIVYENIKELINGKLEVYDYTLYEESLVKSSIDINIPTIHAVARIVPFLFFFLVMLIISLFMGQIFNQEKKNIGIYKALGFNNKEILPLFLCVGVIVSFLSLIIGILIGYLIEYFIMQLYFEVFQMPKFIPSLSIILIIITGISDLLVCLLSSFISSYKVFNIEPKDIMMVQSSNARDPKLIRKLKLPLSIKLSITIVIRNFLRFIFSSLCISAAIIMLLCALLLNNSGDITVEQTYNKRFNFDCLVYYTSRVSDETKEKFSNNTNITKYQVIGYAISNTNSSNRFGILGLEDTSMIRLIGDDGFSYMDLNDGIILSYSIANIYNLKVDDFININGKNVKVRGISRQFVSSLCYMKKETMEELGLLEFEAILANFNNKNQMSEFVSKTSNYLSIEYKDNLEKYTNTCYNNIRPVVYLVIGMAIIIGSFIIYNISQINLVECSKEISIMKSLGVRQSYINRTWLIESLLKFILASIIGIPLGAIFGKYVLHKMKNRLWEFPYFLSFKIVLITILITLFFVLVSHFLSIRRVEKWNLALMCKGKE